MRTNRGDDVACDLSGVERVRAALGQLAQGGGELGVRERRADRLGLAVRAEEVGTRRVVELELLGSELAMQSLGDREALLGQLDRGPEEVLPGQLAVARVRHFQEAG